MATPRYSRIDAPEMSQGEPDYFNRLSGFSNTIPDGSLNTATSPDYDARRQAAGSRLPGTRQGQESINSPQTSLPPYRDYSDSPIVILGESGMHTKAGYAGKLD